MNDGVSIALDLIHFGFAIAGIPYALFADGPKWLSHLEPWKRSFIRLTCCQVIFIIWCLSGKSEA